MADVDEDAPVTSLSNVIHEDHDAEDELQDFRFLSLLGGSGGTDSKKSLPKRGEKDFEQHGTKHQDSVLEASRQAMHDALNYTRIHVPKNAIRAYYYGDILQEQEEGEDVEELEVLKPENRKSLERDHIVMVENSKGPHFRTTGKTNSGTSKPKMWLLPEEALYLVERGNLDLWWPPLDDEDESDEGTPMSVQAAYAMLIGEDGEHGKVGIERYNVYANLKRAGYVVNRAPSWDPSYKEDIAEVYNSPFSKLWELIFAERRLTPLPYGPLVQPGLYRSYQDVYRRLAVIERYKPSAVKRSSVPEPEHPFRIDYHVWKPSRIPTYAKSNPGIPDFRVATASSRSTNVPTLLEMDALLQSTPFDPPDSNWKGPGRMYQRLKHGWRNVVLAVVDQGIISYLRLGDAAFGEEKLYERFDQAPSTFNKKGGRGKKGGR